MTKQIDKDLRFVLRHYKHGALDTKQALRKVRERTGLPIIRPVMSRYRWIAAAAIFLLFIVVGSTYYNKETLLAADDVTQTFMLPDQTHVTLSPHSTLAYRKWMPRKVKLHGDAYFEVTHEERHPFYVTNEISQVLVLGTKFMVSSKQEQTNGMITTDVYVTEGKVGFSPKEHQSQQVVLTRGMKARLIGGNGMPQLIEAGSVNQTAWATGTFHFSNTPLDSVLNDLSAHYCIHLYSDNTNKRLNGDFKAEMTESNLHEIIRIIEKTLDVKIHIQK